MYKNKSFLYSIAFAFLMVLSMPLQAWEINPCCCNETCCDDSYGITGEVRVAYYHPSSSRVRRIYGDGWADYQFELSSSLNRLGGLVGIGDLRFAGIGLSDLNLDWKIWAGVSGFSRKGDSIGFHDDTRLQLIPVYLGLKIFYPLFCNVKAYIGGAGCYSFLRIRDDSDYVHRHTRKEAWGGVIQSGLTYNFCEWGVVSVFSDYFFQQFHFHDSHYSSFTGSTYYHESRYIERSKLNMSGYKVGVGLGVTF